ncbi:uncharacterized protein [Apostichopus japonicus]|uniref:uncharacterized protein n=1 Tax=Stichopus japonicus TaxID=307972 RepID=UPI003AB3AE2E
MAGNPPPYTPLKEDYQSPPQGYPPGYGTPQHQGYPTAPPPQGYPPSQQSAYPPQQVIVVNNQTPLAPAANNTVLVTTTTARPQTNHLLHLLISLFFWPWLIVWLILCIVDG